MELQRPNNQSKFKLFPDYVFNVISFEVAQLASRGGDILHYPESTSVGETPTLPLWQRRGGFFAFLNNLPAFAKRFKQLLCTHIHI